MPSRVLHPQPVFSTKLYIASGGGHRLPVVKRIRARIQREVKHKKETMQTSIAKEHNSHALPCWILNKKPVWMSIHLHSNHFSSPVLLIRRAWRPSRA